MQIAEFLGTGDVSFKVHPEAFEIRPCDADQTHEGAFALIVHDGVGTIVRKLASEEKGYSDRRYRMLTFGELPMDLVGFLSVVSFALAERKIPIFVISSYDTDHVLVPERDLKEAIRALESRGFRLNGDA